MGDDYAKYLSTILHKKDESFDQAIEIARRVAKDFGRAKRVW
jgi:hypothetical protein